MKNLCALFCLISVTAIAQFGGGGYGFGPSILGDGWAQWTDPSDTTSSLIFSNASGAVIKFTRTSITPTVNFSLPSDIGNVFLDLPVTATTTGGTKIGYTNRVDGNDALRVYAQSDGSGNVTNISVDIKGVSGAIAANAGYVGEAVSSKVAFGSAVGVSSGVDANVTSISLTAGDWDVSGNVNLNYSSATVTGNAAGITTTSATVPGDGTEISSGVRTTTTSEIDGISIPAKQINVATTTTVYLCVKATFSAGSCSCYGSIFARRVR